MCHRNNDRERERVRERERERERESLDQMVEIMTESKMHMEK